MLFGGEEAADSQGLLVGHAAQPVPQRVEAVGRVADAKGFYAFRSESASGQILARHSAFRPAHLLLEPCGCRLVQLQQLGPLARSGSLFRRRKLPLGQRNPALARDDPHRLGKADVLDLRHKRKNVTRSLAAKAVVELPHRMDGERRRLLLVEGAEACIVLRPRLAQPDVALDHLNDVGLLLDGLGEVDHGVCIEDKAGGWNKVKAVDGDAVFRDNS